MRRLIKFLTTLRKSRKVTLFHQFAILSCHITHFERRNQDPKRRLETPLKRLKLRLTSENPVFCLNGSTTSFEDLQDYWLLIQEDWWDHQRRMQRQLPENIYTLFVWDKSWIHLPFFETINSCIFPRRFVYGMQFITLVIWIPATWSNQGLIIPNTSDRTILPKR